MAIISPLPYTIANGDPVDATPVMADLTQIVDNVNANAANVAGNASQQFLVATTANPAGAVPLSQAQSQFAALNGSSAQVFNVANAATATEAVALGQAQADFAALNGSSTQVFNVASATSPSNALPLYQTLGAGASGNAAYAGVTASRALDTAYTNNTSRPLVVCVEVNTINTTKTDVAATILLGLSDGSVISGAYASASVAGNTNPSGGGGYYSYSGSVTFIVPPGGLYMAHVNPVISNNISTSFFWLEY